MANNNLILRSTPSPYGDVTKNKTLSLSELDNNQIYLKGLTIDSAEFSGDTLTLTRLNGNKLTVDITGSGGTAFTTATNGLTGEANVVRLGGILNQNTVISGATNDLSFGTSDSKLNNLNIDGITATFDYSSGDFSTTHNINPLQTVLQSTNSSNGDTSEYNFANNSFDIKATDGPLGEESRVYGATTSLELSHRDTGAGSSSYLYLYTTGTTLTVSGKSLLALTEDTGNMTVVGGGRLQIGTGTTENTFTDFRTGINQSGLEYGGIYSDNYTLNSLITLRDLNNATDIEYGNIIFVSESGTTSGVTRNDVVGDIGKPVSLEYATQIAQSGDTIHVKAGTYNVQTTGFTGLSVDGVNHYFEEGAKVYKSTAGNMFATSNFGPIFAEANVYGSGSFYGSGSCDYIYYNFGIISDTARVFEWDICENTADKCYFGLFNGNTILKGKRRMYSPYDCIDNSPSDFYDLYVECPVIESLSGHCVSSSVGAGTMGNLTVKGDRIISSTPFNTISNGTIQDPELLAIYAGNHADDSGIYIEANYITSLAIEAVVGTAVATVNASRVDVAWNRGTRMDINAHVGQFEQISGLSNVALCDMPRGSGTGKINVTVNGDFIPQASYQQQIPFAGDIEINLKQFVTQTPGVTPDFGSGRALFSGSPVRFLGTWYLDEWWVAVSGSRVHIPTDTYINLGPKGFLALGAPESARNTEVFNVASDILFAGTIVEHCDYNLGPCPMSDSGVTYSALPVFRNSGNTILNGATYVARDSHSQLVSSAIAKDVKVYSGGLTTNKIGVFDPIAEKMRVTVTDSGATITVNSETFTTTTGTTAEACAAELVSLIGASGTVGVTPSQDNPGVDDNFYLTSDVVANSILATFDVNTELDILIDRLAIGVTEVIGGTVIESTDVTDYIFETINP